MNQIYIPETDKLSNEILWKWYANVAVELQSDFLTDTEKKYVADYYEEAGLLPWWRRPFFQRHFVESFTNAARYLLGSSASGAIVDLGCGTGTQSLFLAMSGAKVVGLDMDTEALVIFRKRKIFYEEILGRSLDIEIHEGDVFDIDLASFGDFRGIYSMFAFNMMQPSSRLLDQLVLQMVPNSRFVVLDGNSKSFVARLWPGRRRNVWDPQTFSQELSVRSINVAEQRGGVVLPPIMWRILPYPVIAALDRSLCGSLFLSVSHQVMGELAEDNSQ